MELKILIVYPLPALLTPLPLIPFSIEKITGCTNDVAKGANKAPRNPPSCLFISFFTVLVTPSINTHQSSNHYIIFIISSIPSFKIDKVNPFPTLTAPFPVIFLSNLFIVLEVELLTNPGKFSLKELQYLSVLSFLTYLTKNQKIHLIELF